MHGTDLWRTSILVFVFTTVLSALGVIGVLAALDPYDSGRFALAPLWQARVNGEKWVRARDPQFDSAIIGDSRSEMIRPALLDEKTGLKFVSLSLRGSQAIEGFVVLRSFIRHHPNPQAIVIGLHEQWCYDPLQSAYQTNNWFFPTWLYEDGTLSYLAHLFTFRTIQQILSIRYTIPFRPDGFEDYEEGFHRAGADAIEAVRRKMALVSRPVVAWYMRDTFPGATELSKILWTLPPSAAVVLAWVPEHILMVPAPDSPAAHAMEKCRAAYAALAAVRPHTVILDTWQIDRPENRSDENYFDGVHYRKAIAEAFGADIAAYLNAALGAPEKTASAPK